MRSKRICWCYACNGKKIPRTTEQGHADRQRSSYFNAIELQSLLNPPALHRGNENEGISESEIDDNNEIEDIVQPEDVPRERLDALLRRQQACSADAITQMMSRELYFDCGFSMGAFIRGGLETCLRSGGSIGSLNDFVSTSV
jgi:hypothetical protein